MAGRLQLRRGTTSQNDAFTGAIGELTLDTQKKQIRLHDGSTLGGAGVIDPVVAFQVPTAANNYTWYRKYADGWVEQGGIAYPATVTGGQTTSITLPVEMSSANYTVLLGFGDGDVNNTSIFCFYHTRTATGFKINTNLTTTATGIGWEAKGMAA